MPAIPTKPAPFIPGERIRVAGTIGIGEDFRANRPCRFGLFVRPKDVAAGGTDERFAGLAKALIYRPANQQDFAPAGRAAALGGGS